MIAPSLLLVLNVLLSQFSQAVIKQDYETIRNHSATIAQILLIRDREKIYLKNYGQYLVALSMCESQRNKFAVNKYDPPKGKYNQYDLQSWGLYQFKTGTLLAYGKKYDFLAQNATIEEAYKRRFDDELQEKIVVKMLEYKENLQRQFPTCHPLFSWLLNKELVQK